VPPKPDDRVPTKLGDRMPPNRIGRSNARERFCSSRVPKRAGFSYEREYVSRRAKYILTEQLKCLDRCHRPALLENKGGPRFAVVRLIVNRRAQAEAVR